MIIFPTCIIIFFILFQVLSALDILQPPHLDFFQEMYPFCININHASKTDYSNLISKNFTEKLGESRLNPIHPRVRHLSSVRCMPNKQVVLVSISQSPVNCKLRQIKQKHFKR